MTASAPSCENLEAASAIAGERSVSCHLREVAQGRFPVFLDLNLEPCFLLERGGIKQPVLIASIPKAGTYLFGRLLSELGLVDCRIHVNDYGFTDYRFASLEESQREHRKLRVTYPVNQCLSLVRGGQFVVGHLSHNDQVLQAISNFRAIFIHRDLRDAMVSQMRFFSDHGRGTALEAGWGKFADGPEKMKQFIRFHGDFFLHERCRKMLGWLREPNVVKIAYEELVGDRGKAIQSEAVRRICAHIGVDEPTLDEEFFSKLFGAKTMTRSGSRTQRNPFWDQEVEAYFRSNGGIEMNERLGHEGAA